MSRPLRVLVLSPHEQLRVRASAREATVHECHDLADMLGRAAAGAADIAVVAADCAGLDRAAVIRLLESGCAVIGVTGDPAHADQLRRIGISQVAAGEVTAGALRSCARDAAATGGGPAAAGGSGPSSPSPPPPGGGRVVAVWGPPGAPGRTTVARSVVAAAHDAGVRALFLDGDPAAGGSDEAEPGGLARAARLAASGRLDRAGLLGCCGPHPQGGWQLAGLPDPLRWSQIAPGQFRDVVAVARAAFEVVVIDVGQDIRPAHPAYDAEWAHDSAAVPRAAVGLADVRLAVLLATPGGVARFAAWSPLLREHGAPWLVVANRVGLPGAGPRPGVQVQQVLRELGHEDDPVLIPDGTIPGAALWGPLALRIGWDGSGAEAARRPRRRVARRWPRVRASTGADASG